LLPILGSSKSPFGESKASALARSTCEFPTGTKVSAVAAANTSAARLSSGNHTLLRTFTLLLIKRLQTSK
jgi:hypothetical protein